MPSMDLDTIIQDLTRRFAAPLPEFYQRAFIFWHDEDQFEDKLDESSSTMPTSGSSPARTILTQKSCFYG